MPRAGRDLEELVSHLERLLSGTTGVEIKSPDYVTGLISGSRREIDVSLRSQIGSARVLVIVECRDRDGTEDVTWIEQIATKREDVGADKAVAVSTDGFSQGAQNMAALKQIELRTIEDIDAGAIFEWLQIETVDFRIRHVEIETVTLGVEDSDVELSGPFAAQLSSNSIGIYDAFLIRKSDGVNISVDDIWSSAPNIGLYFDRWIEGTPAGEVKQGKLGIIFSPPYDFAITTTTGLADVLELIIGGGFHYEEREAPIARRYTYRDSSGAIVESAEAIIEHEGVQLTISLHGTPSGSKLATSVTQSTDESGRQLYIDLTTEFKTGE